MEPDLAAELLPAVRAYLRCQRHLVEPLGEAFELVPLAQGEYNLNYLATASRTTDYRVVVRLNTGSQEVAAGARQILYEAGALRLLAPTGLAPALLHVDAAPGDVPFGLLVEEFIPGRPLDYGRAADLNRAAAALARLHTYTPPAAARRRLLAIDRPLTTYLAFGRGMAARYRAWPRADRRVLRVLEVVERALAALAPAEARVFDPARRAIVHTDVQAHNFVVQTPSPAAPPERQEARGTRISPPGPAARKRVSGRGERGNPCARLVDWEKPMLDDPSYDLCHFLAPTSTRWRCGVTLDARQRRRFLDAYAAQVRAAGPGAARAVEDLEARVGLRQPFVHWRAIAWCAMAWVEYQDPGRPLRNADTRARIAEYLQPDFLEALFDPILSAAAPRELGAA